jgi:hypothetical protein
VDPRLIERIRLALDVLAGELELIELVCNLEEADGVVEDG